MNTSFASIISVALCALLASCYPYNEGANRPKTKKSGANKTAPATQNAADVNQKAEETAIKEVKPKTTESATTGQNTDATTTTESIKPTEKTTAPTTGTTTAAADKPAVTKKPEYSFASKVPGKEGFVFSPYNNKVVDVRDIPSGTLVQDPTYPAAEKKYFRVP